jgi:hypothetical protein
MWIMIILLVFLQQGCKKSSEADSFLPEQEFTLKSGESYSARKDNLRIRVKEINDSRCPTGVFCFWQGEAIVFLEVNDGKSWDVTLSTIHQPVDTVNDYIFRLIDVLPYPVYPVEVPDSEKTVVLRIEKL